MSRLDEIKSRHKEKQAQLGIDNSEFEQKRNPTKISEKKIKKNFSLKSSNLLIGIISLVLVVLIFFLISKKNSSIEDYEQAVGVIVVASSFESLMESALPWLFDEDDIEPSGNQIHMPLATGFSIGDGKFVTNAHITEQLSKILANGGEAYIKLNKLSNYVFPIEKVRSHPKYDISNFNQYDVGLIYVQGEVPYSLKVEKKGNLEKLKAGDEIMYIGFPMQNLPKGGLNLSSLVATIQVGNITSISDYQYKFSSPKLNYLIRHNLGATGGASGSPIINKQGNVVAILNAITVDVPSEQTGLIGSEAHQNPSAVMINYAQRADLIYDISEDPDFFK